MVENFAAKTHVQALGGFGYGQTKLQICSLMRVSPVATTLERGDLVRHHRSALVQVATMKVVGRAEAERIAAASESLHAHIGAAEVPEALASAARALQHHDAADAGALRQTASDQEGGRRNFSLKNS